MIVWNYCNNGIWKILLFHNILVISSHTQVSYEDFSRSEELLFNYYKYFGELKWKWSKKPFCRMVHSVRHAQFEQFTLQTEDIILTSFDCAKIQAEILVCYRYYRLDVIEEGMSILNISGKKHQYVSGLNGEIYEVRKASESTWSKCEEKSDTAFVLAERIVDDERSARKPLQLLGIANIFEQITTYRETVLEKE